MFHDSDLVRAMKSMNKNIDFIGEWNCGEWNGNESDEGKWLRMRRCAGIADV